MNDNQGSFLFYLVLNVPWESLPFLIPSVIFSSGKQRGPPVFLLPAGIKTTYL